MPALKPRKEFHSAALPTLGGSNSNNGVEEKQRKREKGRKDSAKNSTEGTSRPQSRDHRSASATSRATPRDEAALKPDWGFAADGPGPLAATSGGPPEVLEAQRGRIRPKSGKKTGRPPLAPPGNVMNPVDPHAL